MATPTDVAERALDAVNPPELKVEKQDLVEQRMKRGKERLSGLAPSRKEAIAFAENEHYVSLGKEERLAKLDTVPIAQGGEKPDHRVRISRDIISPVLKSKISATTQRTPSYESIATSPDPEDFSGSKLAEKVAIGGYELWRLRKANKKLVWNALVTKEGFIRPYWNPNVGPFIENEITETVMGPEGPEEVPTGQTEAVGMGEVGVQVYSGLEVSYEDGVDFEDSPWYLIENARPVEEVEKEPGFQGKLNADADASDSPAKKKGSKLVMVSEYLERPCPDWPEGRRLIFANGKVIFPEEAYPLRSADGEVVDEPCLHRLTYDIDSKGEGKGLVSSMIESVRQYDQAGNKILEWIQLTLVPRLLAEEGTMVTEPDDTPGGIDEYNILTGQNKPEWQKPGEVPRELFELQDRAQLELANITQDGQPAAAKAESGKQAQAILQNAAVAWQDFVEDYAEIQGRVMRDCLTLVQLHYTEDRLVKFRGRTGWESIEEFKGTDIRGQTDLRVNAASLEPRTRATNEQRIMNIANMFPGHFPPEVLISALEGGSAEKLIEGYEDDVSRVNRIISLIRSGGFWDMPMRPVFPGEEAPKINPETGEVEMQPTGQMEPVMQGTGVLNELGEEEQVEIGQRPVMQPVMETELPGWMPRAFVDNVGVWKSVMGTWMKTDDWEKLDEAAQRASMDVFQALLQTEEKEAQRQQMMQSEMAASAGMKNAARPPGKPMPSLPRLEEGEG